VDSFAFRFRKVAPAEKLNDSCNLDAHRNCLHLVAGLVEVEMAGEQSLQSSIMAIGNHADGAFFAQRLLKNTAAQRYT
jgi:hypothetical protein